MGEIELKFLVEEPALRQLRSRARALKLANGAAKTRTLRSVYLDTANHALKKAGIALRLRRDGRRWIQTVKAERVLHGGLSQAAEAHNPAPGGRASVEAISDPVVRDRVLQCVDGSPLEPVCETVMRRTALQLARDTGTRAELAIDVGEIHAGEQSASLREAEIELIDGNPRDLFDIAKVLLPDSGWRFSRLSKGARGYLLAEEGRVEPVLAPRNAKAVPLDPAQTVEQAARDILRECFDQIATNIAVVQALDDPEGPHQLRIGLRRLRSAFSVFRSVFSCPEMTRLQDETRWLGQAVGRVRDMDVVLFDIVQREAAAYPDEPALARLAERLLPQAENLRRHLRELLAESRIQRLLIDLARFTETRGWLLPHDFEQSERLARPVADFAREGINKRWKKVTRQARGIAALDTTQRHELRKELKKLRYVVEFLAPLYPQKRVGPFVKRLRKLQTIFGELNDAETVKAMFAGRTVDATDDRESERAIGWVTGASLARADCGWAQAKALWRDLEDTKRFWR